MVQKVELLQAKDGKTFKFKNAAKRYERGLILAETIDGLPGASEETKEFIKNNWEDLRKMVRNSGSVLPNEDVPDNQKISAK